MTNSSFRSHMGGCSWGALIFLLAANGLHAQQADGRKAAPCATDQTVVGLRVFDDADPVTVSNGVRFVKGDGGKLRFKRPPRAARTQLFRGFEPGDITFEAVGPGAEASVYPEWWGAAGNDAPSCAKANVAAINAALTAVSNTHLAVSLEGTYCIDGQLFPRSGSTLKGPGAVKAVPGLSLPPHSYLIEVRGQSEVVIDGVEVDGNRLSQAQDAAHTYGGIYVTESTRCTVRKCVVHHCNGPLNGGGCGNGIRTRAASDVLIADNTIHSNNGCGINIYYASKRVQAVHNTIFNNTEIGIESEGRNGRNYAAFRNEDIFLFDNEISGHTEPDRREDHAVLVDWTDEATVLSNRCRLSRSNGIEILGCRQVVIAGNTCKEFGGKRPADPWAAVRITAERYGEDGRSQHVAIFGNDLSLSLNAVYLDTVDGAVIGENRVAGIENKEPLKVGPGVNGLQTLPEAPER